MKEVWDAFKVSLNKSSHTFSSHKTQGRQISQLNWMLSIVWKSTKKKKRETFAAIDDCANVLEELCVQRTVGVDISYSSNQNSKVAEAVTSLRCSADINSHVGSAEHWCKHFKPYCIHLRCWLHILNNISRIS